MKRGSKRRLSAAAIKEMLDIVKEYSSTRAVTVGTVRDALKASGLEPKDIGETPMSLGALERNWRIARLKATISHLQRCPNSHRHNVLEVLRDLEDFGLTPEDVGEITASLAALDTRHRTRQH